ncbi:methylenetetrahydrofolate reductase C-terminal domain-containing protein [Desulfomonile tiedjei]|uniref:Methylene-tetrahydrofolate reductase C terminal n=1 Tax=Desulfomonile tiedjei (strain ATCC 49306 / DSM 6799 / DCB-1) TaxID=706587 RepID=I4CF26_DESTA|nr:methylenetetrahydrofolate reductase C-terminal domain-containing protein [Desulfomonile tiedjei]AFM28167.1 Methylene-tetrahydrofolate reductase C terminal [Desulfomonile tiedjei DSM 6799]
MVIGERKPFDEIMRMIEGNKKIMVLGCGGCVTVCLTGGHDAVRVLSSQLRIAREKEEKPLEIIEHTIERQCDPEYIEQVESMVPQVEAVVSMACGAGVQFMAEKYMGIPVYPALNTGFVGGSKKEGYYVERCQTCGECKLAYTGGICPIARCSKSLLNGPCGGSTKGKCEIDPDVDCAWQLIIDRLKSLNLMDRYEQIMPSNDWRSNRDGGPRKMIREDFQR